jgi:oligopeptidase B
MSKETYTRYRVANWADVLKNPDVLDPSIRKEIDDLNTETKAWFDQNIDAAVVESIAEDLATLNIEANDAPPAPRNDGYWYFSRTIKGENYPLLCRYKDGEGKESSKVIFDANRRAQELNADFYSHDLLPSPDGTLLAIAEDTVGSEFYTLRFLDLETGQFLPDSVPNTAGVMVWANTPAAPTLYFLESDHYHRPAYLKRYTLGTLKEADVLYHNTKPEWDGVDLYTTTSGRFIGYSVGDFHSDETYLFRADDPAAKAIKGPAAEHGRRYDVTDAGDDTLYLRTNLNGADEYQIMRATLNTWHDVTTWKLLDIPAIKGRYIVDLDSADDVLCLRLRHDCENSALIYQISTGQALELTAEKLEPAIGPAFDLNPNLLSRFKHPLLRLSLSAPNKPAKIWDADLAAPLSPEIKLVDDALPKMPKTFRSDDFIVERHWATSHDGVQVPITLLKPAKAEGPLPCLLYGYGAYGIPLPARFSPAALSLVKRGMAYAYAHTRGGSDRNNSWYLSGKFGHKENTFKDFIACAEYLTREEITEPGKIVAEGRSAGGLLMGVVTNQRPDLFGGVIAGVPFVDVYHTMNNADLPLTPGEYGEWGHPQDPAINQRLKSFSPIDNITPQNYPHVYVSGGLSDYRVTFWEPLIYTLKLRANNLANTHIFLNMNTGAGHFGASGRYGRYGEIALELAFTLRCGHQR